MRTGCLVKRVDFNAGCFGEKSSDATVTAKKRGAGEEEFSFFVSGGTTLCEEKTPFCLLMSLAGKVQYRQ
jgi:hypothetical protein